MTSRRTFFKKTFGVAGALSIPTMLTAERVDNLSDALFRLNKFSPVSASTEEDLWANMAQAFTVSSTILNLNNAGVSPQPKVVQEAVDRYHHLSNEIPTYYMWHVLDKGRESLRNKLAGLAGTNTEEIAINRNTTESLGTVTFGLTFPKGSEIIMTKQDYPNMIHAWKQKELRDGIMIKWIDLALPFENDDTIVKAFVEATSPRTKVWHITHMINWTGQILPVKKLCEEARKRKIISIVDGAQSFGQLDFKISDFKPDYFGTSLHKWLCAPFGTGMLYVRKENIESLWPLFPTDKPQSPDIRKFELLGTRSFATEQAIGQAIDFHYAIGAKRKEERLRYLKNYWCAEIMKHPRIRLNISLKSEYSCALGNFSIDGMLPDTIVSRLFNEYQIHTVSTKLENLSGIRVTPHVYTTTRDLDRFIEAVLKIASS
jgi:selenocysteine lyase/cysteine desulfurase